MEAKTEARVARLSRRSGPFRLSEAMKAGVHPEQVRRLVHTGRLTRVGRGLYAPSDQEPTDHQTLVEVAARIPKGIFCLLTALRFHELGTQNPREVWIAVDRSAGTPRVDVAPVRIVRMSHLEPMDGVETHVVGRIELKVTSPARTVAECFKYRNKIGVDVASDALRVYRRLRKGTVDDLWHHAERLRVARVLRPYWDGQG